VNESGHKNSESEVSFQKVYQKKARIDVVWSLPALAALSYMPVYYIMQWGCRERGLLEQ